MQYRRRPRVALRILDDSSPARPRVARDARERVLERARRLLGRMTHGVGREVGKRLFVRVLFGNRELCDATAVSLDQQERDEDRLCRDQA